MRFEEQDSERCETILEITITAVYFLLQGDEVVYVGKTTDLHSRIRAHIGDYKAGRTASWTGFAYIVCRPEDVGFEEAKYIAKYRPNRNLRERGPVTEVVREQTRDRQRRFRERARAAA
jgi:hypothetical protein